MITLDHSAVAATNTTVTEEETTTRETSSTVPRLFANEIAVADNVPKASTDTVTTSNAVDKSKRCNNKKSVVVNKQGICTRGQTAFKRRFTRASSSNTSGPADGGNSEGRVTRGSKRTAAKVKTSEVKNIKNNDNTGKNKKRRLF